MRSTCASLRAPAPAGAPCQAGTHLRMCSQHVDKVRHEVAQSAVLPAVNPAALAGKGAPCRAGWPASNLPGDSLAGGGQLRCRFGTHMYG